MTSRKSFTLPWLKSEIRLGEDSTRQFKRDIHNSDSLAAEIVAFANADGGTILIGVTDDGTPSGLAHGDLQRINQLIANVASQAVRSPVTVQTRNIPLPGGRVVVAVTVPKGLDKPYFDRNGVIWLKAGSDKRRLNSREELLVNALIHRDYLVSAPVRLFIFSDHIEIISPGHLPNNLTVDNIRNGNSNIRNPILASYVAKGLLPYRGLGSGVPRAIEAWPQIELHDDRDGMLFIAKVTRPKALPGSEKSSEKSSEIEWDGTAKRILEIVAADPAASAREVAARLGLTPRAIEKQFASLKAAGRLQRIGPSKGGRWQVPE